MTRIAVAYYLVVKVILEERKTVLCEEQVCRKKVSSIKTSRKIVIES